jgi:hypothetical protein
MGLQSSCAGKEVRHSGYDAKEIGWILKLQFFALEGS